MLVKVFYSFKDSDTTCLCSFDIILERHYEREHWIPISLKQCLLSVCSSCPDQLMRTDYDMAIYSANIEESNIGQQESLKDVRNSVIWEGHGLLSNLLRDNEHITVTGQIAKATEEAFDYTIQVLLQLHPVCLPTFRPFSSSQPPLQPSGEWPRHMNLTSHPYDDRSYRKLTPPLSNTSIHPSHQQNYPHQYNSPPSTLLSEIPPTSTSSTSSTSTTPPPPSSSSSSSYTGTVTTSGPISSSGTRKTPVDTFYHQSRRKKRDTKPPNTSDVRPFIEVNKDIHGRYILPVEVDSWTVLDLGSVVYNRVAFHNQRYIYPVGYCVKKWYRSMVDPHSDTQYTCQILDGGDEPIFQLEADDNPGEVWRGPTPTTVWTIAVRRAFAIRNMDYGHNPVGPDFFGLRKNTIAKMIQDLPNADKCKNYIWQNFEAITTSGTKNKAMRRSNTRVSTSSSSTSTSSESAAITTTSQVTSQQSSMTDDTKMSTSPTT
ncbi:F/Y-rich N-terminus-domain-containing protein [Halteromyces radiatus]|uniref:F/Y-rich N-terminus-domain-containing protein n=1 Tax=Halteromyces radiatus TaxID=101107 RepID=UPI00221E79D1|nr:F/Y-rich N-terminus-domain-containing protein [Halteromyces radiatus]KAI8086382.1 F/Y-rich N-terminus-domain-containing protein [Halteromyces radiatus]